MSESYDLKSVKLPNLDGAALKLMVRTLEGPLKGPLMGSLMKNAGVRAFRRLLIEEPPTCKSSLADLDPAPAAAEAELPVDPPAIPGFKAPTIRDFAEAYRSKKSDPVAVAERILEAIKAGDEGPEALHVFIAVDRGDLLRQAKESAERFSKGVPLGPLDGVPVAVKDEIDMCPFPTTVGTSFLGGNPVARDATVIDRLRAAGAILIGKTNMHEIGISPTGFNPHYGQTRNPHNPSHDTGGSSSGSAGAVAAGLCPLAVGADGGGSIRIPAAFCGVVGLKPTFGRVSEAGAAPLCWSVAHLGPLGATVEDTIMGYAAMAGPDSRDRTTFAQPGVRLPEPGIQDLSGLKVGVFRPWFEHADENVVGACNRALQILKDRGARIQDIEIPGLDAMRVAHAITILSEMATAMAPYDEEHRREFGLDSRLLLAMARDFSATDYILAQRVRTQGIELFLRLLEDIDVIASPAAAVTAPPVANNLITGESDTTTVVEIMRFAFAGNMTGLPAVVVPAGYSPEGLPIGFQLMGRPWEEHRLFEISRVIEAGVERRRPHVFFNLLD